MTTPTVPSLWSAGIEWGEEETAGAAFTWLADDWDAGLTGRPHPFVSIAGRLVNGFGDESIALQSGTWTLGRRDWFDVLTPGTASFQFAGVVEAEIGDDVVVSCEAGVLWVGDVDRIAQTQQTDGTFRTSISATDIIGRLSRAIHPRGAVTIAGDPHDGETHYYYEWTFVAASDAADDVIRWLLDEYAGSDVTLTIGDSAGTIPDLITWYDPGAPTLLDVLNTIERSANAMMALQPDGSLILVMRDYLTASSVTVVDLVGLDAPYLWTKDESAAGLINHWILTQPAYDPDVILDDADDASVELYGDRSYSVSDYLCDSAAHFTAGLKAAMASPRPLVTEGRFHVSDLSQHALLLAPLSWVRQGDDTWQVMSVTHEFSDGARWDVSITADVSQSAMVGVVEPDPDDPPDPTLTTDTQTLTSTKSAVVVKGDTGTYMGNGGGDYLPCGLYAGFRHRPLIDFTTLSWPADFVSVKKATLNLRTTGQVWVAFGSNPRFYAKRITSSWSEGTFNGSAPNQYSSGNSVVWPGPDKTAAGQTLKSISDSENNDISIDVTDILQAAHDSGNFRGIMLVSANEDSHSGCVEFFSDDYATSGFRPELVVVCYVTA